MSDMIKQLEEFLNWFREKHPELGHFERNFDIPFQIGGGITVNNKYKLSDEDFSRLTKIARSYYSATNK